MGTFYWIKGRAHFVAAQSDGTQYDPAIEALEKSVELLPTVWYNWTYLVSALTRRDVNKGKAILAQFARQPTFCDLTLEDVQRYERANPDDNDSIVKARQALREGLKVAGMIER